MKIPLIIKGHKTTEFGIESMNEVSSELCNYIITLECDYLEGLFTPFILPVAVRIRP